MYCTTQSQSLTALRSPPLPLPLPFFLLPQLKESECASLVNKLEVAEARYSALEYRLRADQEEHSMATRELEGRLKEAGDSYTELWEKVEKSRVMQVCVWDIV